MDNRIFTLVALVAVLGSFMEVQSAPGYSHGLGGGTSMEGTAGRSDVLARFLTRSTEFGRLKREIDDDLNGESTTKPTTSQATSSSDTDPTTTLSSTTPSTSPTTTPSTEPTTTPEATSPTTTPTSASTPTSTTPTTPMPTTPESTTPEGTKPTSKPKKPSDFNPRSNFDEPEPEESKKPGPSKDKAPTPGPFFGAPGGSGPGFGSGFGPSFGGYGSGFDPYFGYPGLNSIPSYSPYAWTGTNNGPGYASAGASAGSFAYPGMGYPAGAAASPMGSSSFDSQRFQDNSPNEDNSPKDNKIGYNFGGDPLYNAGPGFFYPGQFPNFNDHTLDMIKQIQAQIEAQHRANMDLHNRLAAEPNYGGSYGGFYGVPQVASASIGLSPYGGFQTGEISPVAPGIESRFADELPPPSGNSYGVFAGSSSSSMTGPDGKPINHKSSVTGVNDNGKVSFRTVHD